MKHFLRFCGIVEEITVGFEICYGTFEYCDRDRDGCCTLVWRVGNGGDCGGGAEGDYDDSESGWMRRSDR